METKIPVSEYCTLKQACEYLALGKTPMPIQYENGIKRTLKKQFANTSYDTQADILLMTFGDNGYDKPMEKASSVLSKMIKNGDITIFQIEDVVTKQYEEFALPKDWELDIAHNRIIINQTSYMHPGIKLEQLKAVTPIKEYNVVLENDGRLYIKYGETIVDIVKKRPGYDDYEWLKFYFDHPYQIITKQNLIDNFKYNNKFAGGDRMCQCIFSAFKNNSTLMHRCFPRLNTKHVVCAPKFTSTDAVIF